MAKHVNLCHNASMRDDSTLAVVWVAGDGFNEFGKLVVIRLLDAMTGRNQIGVGSGLDCIEHSHDYFR